MLTRSAELTQKIISNMLKKSMDQQSFSFLKFAFEQVPVVDSVHVRDYIIDKNYYNTYLSQLRLKFLEESIRNLDKSDCSVHFY